MVKLEFFKICTAGNDFIIIDNRKQKIFAFKAKGRRYGNWSL